MIKTTIQAAVAHEIEGYAVNGILAGYTLYIVRDGDIVFYVGQSTDPLYRLQAHLGLISQSDHSLFGIFIKANAPASYQWTYELWKPEECKPYVQLYRIATFPGRWYTMPEAFDVDEAEEGLIKFFHPCFNSRENIRPNRLPERYELS